MKKTIWLPLLLLVSGMVPGRITSPDPDIFVAATPCDAIPREMLGIPANLDCEMIKWRLTLRRDARNLGRDDFKLEYTYGMTQPGTQGFKNDGFSKALSGEWNISKNTGKTPGKQIFTLKPTSSEMPVSFLQLNGRMLHLLDPQGNLMIGNAGFSYTFNKQNANL